MRRPWWLLLALSVAAAAVVGSAASAGIDGAGTGSPKRSIAEPAPVASLEPEATAALWRRLVSTRSRRALGAEECRPLRAVFYAATDFLRLATKLAASASPCAEYYVSVPPIVGNKTQIRRDAAWRIRALGSNFHALAEIHFTSWSKWVEETGSSWYTAGTTARERMAAAGFDVSKGDTWALNELSSAVRRNTGMARANIRELLRGLYEGDGTLPTRGAAFVIGVGQRSSDLSLYQTNLQNWFADSAFWADMSTYVSDWAQEVYGDARSYAVAGVPLPVRRDYLNDYLQHKLVLAAGGPSTIDTVRTYLQSAFLPLANAAWEREAGYGWTMLPAEQMAGYVSAQVQALRHFSATAGQPLDHWGFAWAPRNATGASAGDFAARSGLVLDRLAAAIRDTGESPDAADPGGAACGPSGQNLWCLVDVEGGRLNEAWRSFRGWVQSALAFGTQAQTVRAGTPTSPLGLVLVTSTGLRVTTPTPLVVTVRSSSGRGAFSTSPGGPWSPTLSVTIPAGSGTVGGIFYTDTRAGSAVVTASAAGATSGTQTLTVTPGPVASLAVAPDVAAVRARTSLELGVSGVDAYGNAVAPPATWSVTPRSIGTLASRAGSSTTFTALRTLGPATVVAEVAGEAGRISAEARLEVVPGRLRIGSIRYRRSPQFVLLGVTALDAAARPVSRATVAVLVRKGGRPVFSARATTGPAGRAVFRVPARPGACLNTRVRRASAAGFVWDGRVPRNRYCLPRPG